jgi:hypothetical protein
MRMTIGQLRRLIRETIEEGRLDEALLKEEHPTDKLRRWWLTLKGVGKKIVISDLSPEDQEELDDLKAEFEDERAAEEEMKRYEIGPGVYSKRPRY